jgi:signal peptidase II
MRKYGFVAAVAASIVVLDQLTKWMITRSMELHESVPVIDSLFHITYVRNRGGAFSILSDQPDAIRIPFFVTVSIVALATLVYFLRSVAEDQKLLLFALAGILGGAIGNFTDRITAGTVVDFLDVHWRGWYWPAFNVADSFISVGTVIVLLYSFFAKDEPTTARS